MHILSVEQFSRDDLDEYVSRADYHSRHRSTDGQGKILVNLFYEPSTRTSSSFYAAMVRLRGAVIPINNVAYSSVAKGESLEDTIRTMQSYGDLIVLRHPEVGAAKRAAAVAAVPIINAGDGIGEHPTQALLDLYTIRKEIGRINDLHVVMMGDLLHGRTVKSLALLLRHFSGVRISWVSPPSLCIPEQFRKSDEIETDDLATVIAEADVLYVTRVQTERHMTGGTYDYRVTEAHMAMAKEQMALMHPLPRIGEIPTTLDDDPRSAYFRQMTYGLFMRMGILSKLLRRA